MRPTLPAHRHRPRPRPQPRSTPEAQSAASPAAEPDTVLTAQEQAIVDDLMRPESAPTRAAVPVARSSDPREANADRVDVGLLPSGYKAYPSRTKITQRPYWWDEVRWFSNSRVGTRAYYEKILEGIDIGGGAKNDLTLMDFYYIAILRKLSTLGTPEFVITYPAFGQVQRSIISYRDIYFEDLEVEALPAVLKVRDVDIHLSPLRVGAYLDLMDRDLQDNEIAVMAAQVENLPFDEAFELLRSAGPEDMRKLRYVDLRFNHGVAPLKVKALETIDNPDYDEDNPSSDENIQRIQVKREVSVALDGVDTLIFPYRELEEPDGNGVSFGL